VTQTTLTVDAVNVSLLGGSAGVKGFTLGNPEGYKALQSISVSNAAVSLVPGSVLSDKIVIRSVEVRAAVITFEGNPIGANNLTKILDNVKAATSSGAVASTNAPVASPGGQPKAGKKLEVDDFLITGATVHANLTGLVNKEITVTIPDIHLTDLGKGNEGITPADLTRRVLSEITAQTLKTLEASGAQLATDAAKKAVQDALNKAVNGAGTNAVIQLKGLNGLLGK